MITYDSKSWMIDGERKMILSAAVHYFRLPRVEWSECLEKAKAGGCNTIETYIPWNFHEMKEGEWDFTGDKDLAHFLQLCADKELYVIARPGPYICAEWEFGGLPWWLTTKENIQYRAYEPVFLHYVDLYFDRVIPIIEDYQWSKNGTVIMVQVENEFQAFGRPDKLYMEYLRDGLSDRGIDVPLVTCYGGVDGAVEFRNFWSHSDEAAQVLDQRYENQPKGVMEFWIGWFENWGGTTANQKSATQLEWECYQLLIHGFTAINYYMYAGGTNFGHWGGRTVGEQTFSTTSYSYDGALDEYVQPTKKYDVLSRFHSFTNWLEKILTSADYEKSSLNLPAHMRSHLLHSSDGEILFIENHQQERDTANIILDGAVVPVTVEGNAILPVVRHVDIDERLTIQLVTAYTMGFNDTKGVLYQEGGQRSTLILQLKQKASISCQRPNTYHMIDDYIVHFELFHSDITREIHILFENGEVYTIEVASKQTLNTARTSLEERSKQEQLDWESAEEDLNVWSPSVQESVKPLDFSRFGQFSGYLNYQCKFDCAQAGVQSLIMTRIEDPVMVFCNDEFVGRVEKIGAASISIPLKKGENILTCLVQNMGRYNYTAALGEPKGMSESPALNGEHLSLLSGWKVEGCGKEQHLRDIPLIEGRIGFLNTFYNKGYDRALLVGEGVSRVIVNGRPPEMIMESNTAWSADQAVHGIADLSKVLVNGENVIDFDVRNLSAIGRFDLYLYKESEQLSHWKIDSSAQFESEKKWQKIDSSTIHPRWYRSQFQWNEANGPVMKVCLEGMSKGLFWVNGHCLGRYWNKGPQEEYKIPTSILGEQNELVLFDEEGLNPEQVVITSYEVVE